MTSLSPAVDSALPEEPEMLACVDIRKAFGGVPVLKGVGLRLVPGTITALAGENGAGKSTLMKIASGQMKADSGEVLVRGEVLASGSARDAHQRGVAIVPQELASILDTTVYENIFVGRERRHRSGFLDRRRMAREAKEMLAEFGVDIDPTVRMGSLPVGLRQIVEIVKATSTGARVLLLDEPTSAIAEREVARLLENMRMLRDRGVAILFTTHKMEEIRAIADRVVVLRDGGLVADEPLSALSDDDIVTAMIGRELEDLFPDPAPAADDVALSVRGLSYAPAPRPVDLQVRRGEIVGLAGLVGAGRTELIEALFGVRPSTGGEAAVGGRPVRRGRPADAITAGMALVPEDRKGAGAVLSMDILANATLPRLSMFSVAGWLRGRSRVDAVSAVMSSVRLRSRGLGQTMETLSGGNQQKVVLARWLTGEVKVLLLDEPTRGVDVGARSEIYRIITELAAAGMAVIMASSDMPEILALSHRALVLKDGGIVAELDRTDLQAPDVQDRIFRLASGLETSDAGARLAPSAKDDQ
ncbi:MULTISPECIES: sugar ABC transporter ATP-binding protein [unclassified Microbacterium]|uniref:sugar ABC transporter ATP-binding protein n=1 Tax=unclassified Microbacterium TaxID=2609290 RepID=UPI0025F7012A|nr:MULTISPECIES: sugar ABC transporter ATP-binding protein [unclassified Microbacterium]